MREGTTELARGRITSAPGAILLDVGGGTTLLVVRHAAIRCNRDGRELLCGSHDAPLSATGRRQVIELREALLGQPPVDAVYSSPLRRAVETAQATPQPLLRRLRLLDSLAEIHCGVMEGMPIEDIRKFYPEVWRRNEAQADEEFRWPGGEPYRRFRRRVLRVMDRIAVLHAGQRVLVFTHAGVINQILGTISRQSAARWDNWRPGNASLTEVLWCSGTGILRKFDDRSHLRPKSVTAASMRRHDE